MISSRRMPKVFVAAILILLCGCSGDDNPPVPDPTPPAPDPIPLLQAIDSVEIFADKTIVQGRVGFNALPGEAGSVPPAQPGSSDTGFGDLGTVLTSFPGAATGRAVRLQPDGRIVVAGTCTDAATGKAGAAVARYHTDGTLNTTFGDNGRKVVFHPDLDFTVADLGIQSDGKLVVAGTCESETLHDRGMFMLRLDADGRHDESFGVDGFSLYWDPEVSINGKALVVRQDQGLVVAGTLLYEEDAFSEALVLGFDRNGVPDESYFWSWSSPGSHVVVNAAVAQEDGKVVIGGSATGPELLGYLLARGKADGSGVDPAYANGIYYDPGFDVRFEGFGLAIQQDQKTLLIGSAVYPAKTEIFYVRSLTSGASDDASWCSPLGACNYPPLPGFSLQGNAMALQPNGRAVGTGTATSEGEDLLEMILFRTETDGLLDKTFELSNVRDPVYNLSSNGVEIQPDGRIVVAGTAAERGGDASLIFLKRFNAYGVSRITVRIDGSSPVDATLDTDGFWEAVLGVTPKETVEAVAEADDGRKTEATAPFCCLP